MNANQEAIWEAMDEVVQMLPSPTISLGDWLQTEAPPEARRMVARLVRCSCGVETMMVELMWRRHREDEPMEPYCPACDGDEIAFVPLN